MSDDASNAEPSALEERLVAYLDGELSSGEQRRVEELLAVDPRARRALQRLEHAWESLGELETPDFDRTFADSTIEMVAVAAGQELQQSEAEVPRRRRRRWMISAACLLVAPVVGFLAVSWLRPNPNAALIADLPVVENIDRYQCIDDVDLLRSLQAQGMFIEPVVGLPTSEADALAAPAVFGLSAGQRRERIEAMGPESRAELARRWERFGRLPAEEQARLRSIHEQIAGDAHADQLRQVVNHYGHWVGTLPAYVRGELSQGDPAERIPRIRQLLRLREDHPGLTGGPHVESRVNMTVVVLVIPLRDRKPVVEGVFAAVSQDFSPSSASLVLDEPRALEEMILGFCFQSGIHFVHAEVTHLNPMGAGFYHLGVNITQVLEPADYPELESITF
ncbi:MAG: hypothetical protein HQ581_03515 [Planctomycetes bacterium]|nr:hypothetical protein [Planctomycetota bacterium]